MTEMVGTADTIGMVGMVGTVGRARQWKRSATAPAISS
ncbi:hypothetical protein Ga0074812_11459 [Parafrankia irregularis]|uniref:Uncharacterized protein n=1 Tax=Parafrankia irregularis TaxID=795642 RepID=A0A0S4QQ37_9ACTN|nr:hypothetical protein Ga0074812_11459 [Parafrankia irregularis]